MSADRFVAGRVVVGAGALAVAALSIGAGGCSTERRGQPRVDPPPEPSRVERDADEAGVDAGARDADRDEPEEPVVATPLPRAPRNGLDVPALRRGRERRARTVTLRWDAPPSRCEPVTFDVRVDDSCEPGAIEACAFSSPEAQATGLATTSFDLSGPLPMSAEAPVGRRYHWQVRACCGGACSGWSRTRYFDLGRAKNDHDGDGLSDVVRYTYARFDNNEWDAYAVYSGSATGVVRRPYSLVMGQEPRACTRAGRPVECTCSQLLVYRGDRRPRTRGPSYRVFDEICSLCSVSYRPVGDVNGDGFDDLAVGAEGCYGEEVLRVYAGSASGLSDVPLFSSTGSGLRPVGSGDVNADGFSDLIAHGPAGTVVFWGTSSGLSPATRAPGARIDRFDQVGDMNADGFADGASLWVATDDASDSIDRAFYAGGDEGFVEPPRYAYGAGRGRSHGDSYSISGGDVDGDGAVDVTIITYLGLYLLRGIPGIGPSEPSRLSFPSGAAQGEELVGFADRSVVAGDLDGDGYDDQVLSTVSENGELAGLRMYRGGPAGFRESAVPLLDRTQVPGGGFGCAQFWVFDPVPVGDMNGDGFDDLMLIPDVSGMGDCMEDNGK